MCFLEREINGKTAFNHWSNNRNQIRMQAKQMAVISRLQKNISLYPLGGPLNIMDKFGIPNNLPIYSLTNYHLKAKLYTRCSSSIKYSISEPIGKCVLIIKNKKY